MPGPSIYLPIDCYGKVRLYTTSTHSFLHEIQQILLVGGKFGLRISGEDGPSVTSGLVGAGTTSVLPNISPLATLIATILSMLVRLALFSSTLFTTHSSPPPSPA